MTASPIPATDTDPPLSPASAAAFAGSRVVGDDGRPLLVFHGTEKAIEGRLKPGEHGLFFTADRRSAEAYAHGWDDEPNPQGMLFAAYLALRAPFVVTREVLERFDADHPEAIEAARRAVGATLSFPDAFEDSETWARNVFIGHVKRLGGYDGLILEQDLLPMEHLGGDWEYRRSFVAFDSDQVLQPIALGAVRMREAEAAAEPGDGPSSALTASDAFRRWFGKSLVADATGAPRVVYHGSRADITEFAFELSEFDALEFGDADANGFLPVWGLRSNAAERERLGSMLMAGDKVVLMHGGGMELLDAGEDAQAAVAAYLNPQVPTSERTAAGLRAHFFSEEPAYTGFFSVWNSGDDKPAQNAGAVYPVFLRVERPVDPETSWPDFVEFYEHATQGDRTKLALAERFFKAGRWEAKEAFPGFVDYALAKGYDGFISYEGTSSAFYGDEFADGDPARVKVWGVFDGAQVKSAIAARSFDPNSADIRLRNGEQMRRHEPTFQRWFEGSKAVNEEGVPLVLYHGTAKDFDRFDTSIGVGSWFTTNAEAASMFAVGAAVRQNGAPQVLPVYLAIKRPASGVEFTVASRKAIANAAPRERAQYVRMELQRQGFDGIIDGNNFIAFEPHQVKSALGNMGAFDPRSPDLRHREDAMAPMLTANEKTQASEAFKAWFGSSAIVTDGGSPMVMYRGTRRVPKPDSFRTQSGRSTVSFTSDPYVASVYSRTPDIFTGIAEYQRGASVGAFYLKIENPLDMRKLNAEEGSLDEIFDLLPWDWSDEASEECRFTLQDAINVIEDLDELKTVFKQDFSGDVNSFEDLVSELYDAYSIEDLDERAEKINGLLMDVTVDVYAVADTAAFARALERLGYDGLIHLDVFDNGLPYYEGDKGKIDEGYSAKAVITTYRPLKQSSIKSAIGNVGTFDSESLDVRHREEEAASVPPRTGVESDEFKRWFRTSRVTNDRGEPMAVFHGTSARSFTKFDTSAEGVHFGTSDQAAARLERARGRGGRPKIISAYLSIQSPLRLHDIGVWNNFNNLHRELSVKGHITPAQADIVWEAWQRTDEAGWKAIKDVLADNGYDGIVYDNDVEGVGESFIAFHATQIMQTKVAAKLGMRRTSQAAAKPAPAEPQAVDVFVMLECLPAAVEEAQVGFHFEEGGCWGMALALAEATAGDIVLRDSFVHAYVELDGKRFDYTGLTPFEGKARLLKPDALVAEAACHGVDAEALYADREQARRIIERAKELALARQLHPEASEALSL